MDLKPTIDCFTLFLACILVLIPCDAFAYIDPGTGSMILQLLLGGIAGTLVVGKLYWHKLLAMFGLGPKTPKEEAVEGENGRKEGDV